MKSLYTVIAAVALASASALALAEPPVDRRGKLMEQLDLTEEQREEMRSIRESGGTRKDMHAVLTDEQKERMKALREEHRGERGKRMEHLKDELDLTDEQSAQMQEIFESGGSREEMRAVLTEEQQEKFDAMKQRRHGAR